MLSVIQSVLAVFSSLLNIRLIYSENLKLTTEKGNWLKDHTI